MENQKIQSLHHKYYTPKIPRNVFIIWIMSRYSNSVCPKSTQFWFVPSECQQNFLHSNRQTWLHNHKLRSLIWNSDFPIPPKLAIDIVNPWRPNCFFFVATRLQSSIKLPMEKFPLVAQLWEKKTPFGLSQKRNWLKVLRNFNLLTHINIQTCSSP